MLIRHSLLIFSLLLLLISGCAAVTKDTKYQDEAVQALTARNYTAAISNLDKAIANDGRNFVLYAIRATAYFNLNKFPEAAADLTKSLELNPRFAQGYYNRGIVRTSQMRFQAAIDDYSMGIALSHDDRYVFKRGTLYLWTKQYARAEKDFNDVIASQPKFADPYHDRAQLYMAQGQTEKAIADYSTAIELKSDFAEAYVNRAEAYQKAGKLDLAKADQSAACKYGDQGMCEELSSKR